MTIFKELDRKQNLTLVKATSFECGIVVLNYEPKRDKSEHQFVYQPATKKA